MNWHHLTIPYINNSIKSVFANHEGTLLRLALGTVFFWFGSLKILGESSVLGIIQAAYPFLGNPPFLQVLGVGELILGAGLIAGWHVRLFATLTALHLTGTLLVPFLAPSAAFNPGFPILTLEGEFVIKNLVLISVSVFLAQKNEERVPQTGRGTAHSF